MLKALSAAAALALGFAGSGDAAARPPTIEPSKVDTRNIGTCETYDPNDPYNIHNGLGAITLNPLGAIGMYVQTYQKSFLPEFEATEYSVKYVGQPQYGVIQSISRHGGMMDLYVPNPGYAGNDRYVAEVTIKGVKFRVAGYIRPSNDAMSDYNELCRRLGLPSSAWKISDAADIETGDMALSMSASLLGALSALDLKMADLAGSALGSTVGEGDAVQITLDTNAAGHGWYVDATPLNNADDYLPTADPTIWKAKQGSEAAGKMDLLSVLLHEYGHALGLQHSSDPRDFMAASLQPGERRLPTTEELSLMSRLVAELKPQNLLAAEETPMMDLNLDANESVLVADATPPAISAPLPNWLSKVTKDPISYQQMAEHIKNYQGQRIPPTRRYGYSHA